MPVPRTTPLLLLTLLGATNRATAQAPNEFDFDTAQLPLTTIPPGSGTLQIGSRIVYAGQNLQLDADLVIGNGGEFVLDRSHLRMRGDITIRRGGRLTVVDSTLLVANDFSGHFEMINEGGLLHTERAVIGGAYTNNAIHSLRFLHLRGTWLARQTTLQATGALIANGPGGWYGNPAHRGGSIFADGLYDGEYADAIHMCGVGDAVLANGSANVGLYLDAAAAGVATTVPVDLESTQPLDVTYGDPSVHEGVTNPIAGSLCRLQLIRHRSPGWQFFVINANQTSPLFTLTLRNVRDAIFGVRCQDVSGAPVLAGPWSSYYSEAPGLPSTQRPGYHEVPPGCSTQIGNVVFRSDANEWSRILSWGLYFTGANTNFTVTGPSAIAEVMVWGGQVHLRGSRSYDLGIQAGIAHLLGAGSLTIENAAVGTHNPNLSFVGLVEANDSSTCSITQARVAPLRLRTTSPAASIQAQNLVGTNNVVTESSGGGTIQVTQATASQNWDLQNLSMDVPGSSVPFWAVTGLNSTLVTDAAPGAPGTTSRELVAGPSGGSMRKSLSLPPDTYVTVIASTRLLQVAGAAPELRVSQGGNVVSASLGTSVGSWRRTHVPLAVVSGTAPTIVELVCSGAATLRIDDVRICINSWWDNDNLANLGFEGGCRHPGHSPDFFRAPDAWGNGIAECEPDAAIVRPGAVAGSRSVRATIPSDWGYLHKDLTFLRPGDQVVVSGWMRGVAAGTNTIVAAQIGDGPTWNQAYGNNQEVLYPCDGNWRQFQMTYVVPPNPTKTVLGLSGWSSAGAQCWFDDLSITIQ